MRSWWISPISNKATQHLLNPCNSDVFSENRHGAPDRSPPGLGVNSRQTVEPNRSRRQYKGLRSLLLSTRGAQFPVRVRRVSSHWLHNVVVRSRIGQTAGSEAAERVRRERPTWPIHDCAVSRERLALIALYFLSFVRWMGVVCVNVRCPRWAWSRI